MIVLPKLILFSAGHSDLLYYPEPTPVLVGAEFLGHLPLHESLGPAQKISSPSPAPAGKAVAAQPFQFSGGEVPAALVPISDRISFAYLNTSFPATR